MKRLIQAVALSASVAFLAACGSSSDTASDNAVNSSPAGKDNAVQVAQATPELSILVEAVTAAGLGDTLANGGPFTILAPTNDAFAALLGELGVSKDQLLSDTALLTKVLTYHVIDGEVRKADVPLGQPIKPLSGDTLKIEADDAGGLSVFDGRGRTANIIATDVPADNAVIHLIDNVILPADKNIVQTAQSISDFSILVEAVIAADLAGTLSGNGPFTVFAPTNAAFADLLSELGVTKEALLSNTELLTQVLTYHVVSGEILKAQVPVGQGIATVQGGSFQVDATFAITDERGRQSNIIATDVIATNGVVHVIDKVILPAAMTMPAPSPSAGSIVAVAQGNPDFSILVEAVVAAGLADTLANGGPFTVFAPTNEAFAALLGELHTSKEALLANTELLTQVLLYHVVEGKIEAADVPLHTAIPTIGGGTFSVNNDFVITDARHRGSQIIATDVPADNGVIHLINKVLLP
ncbi:MAG: fasciclin domain-containing protein [Burkholderiaceae bacterium]